jgi:hypothetical protein
MLYFTDFTLTYQFEFLNWVISGLTLEDTASLVKMTETVVAANGFSFEIISYDPSQGSVAATARVFDL